MTVRIEDSTTGSYLCHASAPGYSVITSRAAEVLMTGRPQISSSQSQTGVEGENVHINCAAISIPKYKSITWTYHGSHLDDSKNPPLSKLPFFCSVVFAKSFVNHQSHFEYLKELNTHSTLS